MIEQPENLVYKRVKFFTEQTPSLRLYLERKHGYFVAKRCFDIVTSLMIIVLVLSWLLPILMVLIKLDSRGPVLFKQKRVGFLGRVFWCYKLRTMCINREADIRQASEDDPRITRIGKFLRVTGLDEFPQFFNVLMGQMSIVGPRPHMNADCNKFANAVSGYKFRNLVKPGITGLAQIKGYRGPTKDFESIFHRYQFDAFYVRNANFWLDARIVRKTIAQIIGEVFARVLKSKSGNKVSTEEWNTSSLKTIQN
ncbi:MAG: sugar transferase [Niastella sp.]|jgi:putative colanic acid biosynthesis UDP-glucose lipid carrier transferase|uniref:sugar transferase n=1 Tax=Niastella sp. TaxID=1869183 RepID=UPI00389B21AC